MNAVKVGIGIAILRDYPLEGVTKVLLGKRKNSHGEGEWGFPGGHLEVGESFTACASREIEEEAGKNLHIEDLRVVAVTNLTAYEPKHYVDIGMAAEWVSGEPEIMEPDKCEEWQWFDIENLPTPAFATVQIIVDSATNPHTALYGTIGVWEKGAI